MKSWILFLCLAICILVSGCAGAASGNWAMKSNQTKDQYWKDRDDCVNLSTIYALRKWGHLAPLDSHAAIEKGYFNQCMKSKGYEWVPETRTWFERVREREKL